MPHSLTENQDTRCALCKQKIKIFRGENSCPHWAFLHFLENMAFSNWPGTNWKKNCGIPELYCTILKVFEKSMVLWLVIWIELDSLAWVGRKDFLHLVVCFQLKATGQKSEILEKLLFYTWGNILDFLVRKIVVSLLFFQQFEQLWFCYFHFSLQDVCVWGASDVSVNVRN